MTNPAGPGYPAAPGYPATPEPKRLRGRRAVQVGIVLLAIGVVAIVVGAILAVGAGLGKVDKFQRVSASQENGTLHFDHSGGYLAYYEAPTITDNTREVPLVGITLTPPAGGPFAVDTLYGGRTDNRIKVLTYQHNSHNGIAMYQFHISEPGDYQVALDTTTIPDPAAVIAFGPSIAGATVSGGLTIGVGALVFVVGLIVLIVGLVRRGRHKSQLNAAAYAGGFSPGYGAAYPAQPYGQQPFAGQPYPAQQPYPGQPYPPAQQQPYPAQQPFPAQQPYPPAQQQPNPPAQQPQYAPPPPEAPNQPTGQPEQSPWAPPGQQQPPADAPDDPTAPPSWPQS
jgi:hypothetical protein